MTHYDLYGMASVMIVDDSDAIRMVLKDIVTIGKHKLAGELQNGEGALQEYIKLKPDIVLLDMAMPKKDGVSVLKEIIEFNPVANVIMISASDNQQTVKECLRLGARAYILKPFNFQEVLDIITKVIKQ
ncbi:response regulator [Candidatus Nitrosotalea bavarica]|uniref:response regulator n=1 Tax=Candidatus Nitrosotalea bavarica TaxID=1903277 RepID=UPI001FE374DD|nr:response regulator [Candidatus Nitrosotalea bavarica]